MRRILLSLMLATTLLAVPAALASDDREEKPAEEEGEQAWVDDCPPDMMCAAESPREADEDKATYDGDCGAEMCAFGDEDCIECSGPSRGPDDCEFCRNADQDEDDYVKAPEGSEVGITSADEDAAATDAKNTVPAPAAALAIVGIAGALGLLLVRRR